MILLVRTRAELESLRVGAAPWVVSLIDWAIAAGERSPEWTAIELALSYTTPAEQRQTEAERLLELIRTWVSARDEWDACPIGDDERFVATWLAVTKAECALRAAAVMDVAATESEYAREIAALALLGNPEKKP